MKSNRSQSRQMESSQTKPGQSHEAESWTQLPSQGNLARRRTRNIVMTAVLCAITIVLSLTPLGLIPVPTPAGYATILQIPTVVAAILLGPLAGGIVGAVFGGMSFIHAAPVVWFTNPLVSVVPRILIGLISFLVYKGLVQMTHGRAKLSVFAVTGFLGSATNTVLVLAAVYLFFPVTLKSLVAIAFVQGLPEAIVSAIVTTVVVAAYLGVVRRGKKSRIS